MLVPSGQTLNTHTDRAGDGYLEQCGLKQSGSPLDDPFTPILKALDILDVS